MKRRYLKRIKKQDKENDLDSNQKKSKIDPEIELLHALDAPERTVFFGKTPDIPSGIKAVKNETRWAMDAAGNTGQFIKYFNLHLQKQNNQIKKIKKMKEKYDSEIRNLQSKIQDQQAQIKKVNKELHDITSNKGSKNQQRKK